MTFGFGFCSVLGKTLVLVRFILAGFGFFPSLKAPQSPTRRSAARIAVRILVPDYDPHHSQKFRTCPECISVDKTSSKSLDRSLINYPAAWLSHRDTHAHTTIGDWFGVVVKTFLGLETKTETWTKWTRVHSSLETWSRDHNTGLIIRSGAFDSCLKVYETGRTAAETAAPIYKPLPVNELCEAGVCLKAIPVRHLLSTENDQFSYRLLLSCASVQRCLFSDVLLSRPS